MPFCTHASTVDTLVYNQRLDMTFRRILRTPCTTLCVFGYKKGQPKFCASHKDDNAVDVMNPMCVYEKVLKDGTLFKCRTHASFEKEGKKPIYCKKHKLKGMVNVLTKRCEELGCINLATHGFPLGVTPARGYKGNSRIYCGNHAIDDMDRLKLVRKTEDDDEEPPAKRARIIVRTETRPVQPEEPVYVRKGPIDLSSVGRVARKAPAPKPRIVLTGQPRPRTRKPRKQSKEKKPVQTIQPIGVERALAALKSKRIQLFLR